MRGFCNFQININIFKQSGTYDPITSVKTFPLFFDVKGNYTKPSNFRKRFYRILDGAKIEKKGLHSLRHTFTTNLVNGIKQTDGTIKSLTPRQVADLLGHSTSDLTEMYYVKRNDDLLNGITNGFEI